MKMSCICVEEWRFYPLEIPMPSGAWQQMWHHSVVSYKYLAQVGACPITFLWLWPATADEPHSQHVPTNSTSRLTETTPWNKWWHSNMAGINSVHSTCKMKWTAVSAVVSEAYISLSMWLNISNFTWTILINVQLSDVTLCMRHLSLSADVPDNSQDIHRR